MILLPQLPAAFYTCDEKGALFQFNEKAANLFGGQLKTGNPSALPRLCNTTLHDEGNQIIGFSKVTRDLTERKTAENELAYQSQEL